MKKIFCFILLAVMCFCAVSCGNSSDVEIPDGMKLDRLEYHYASELTSEIRDFGGFCIGGACYPENHPESETAVSFGNKVILISSIDEAKNLDINTNKLIVTNQTTMSMYDIQDIINCLKSKYPHLETMEKVCSASIERQRMVMETAKQHQNDPTTAFIVIGDKFSHNTKKLADIISEYNDNVYLAESISDVPLKKVKQYETIYLASGTSTPNCIIEEIYNVLNSDLDQEQYISKLNIDEYVK